MNCLSIVALSYFLSIIDPTIVETSGDTVIIKKDDKVMVYTYDKYRGIFCSKEDDPKG